jgi:hypothetical protein
MRITWLRWLRAAITRRTPDPFRIEREEMRRIYG